MKTFTITTNSSTASFNSPNFEEYGHTFIIYTTGAYGSGSLQLQESADGGVTWWDVGAPTTAKSRTVVTVYNGLPQRLTLTGATAPSIGVIIVGNGI